MRCLPQVLDPQMVLEFGQGAVDLLAISTGQVILGKSSYDVFQPGGFLSGTNVLNPSIFGQLTQLKMHSGKELPHLSLGVGLLLS